MSWTPFKDCQIIDISPLITGEIAVFPGDQPFVREVTLDYPDDGNLLLSKVTTTLHLGAHADSSSHYNQKGHGIEKRDLGVYLGHCQVVEAEGPKDIRIRQLKQSVCSERVLIKTGSFPDPNQWTDSFNSLEPELVDELASLGVRLIGIDTPSVDPSDCKELRAHQRFLANDLGVLEGLVLEHVIPGEYQLVALPLPIVEADASPVRAILLKAP